MASIRRSTTARTTTSRPCWRCAKSPPAASMPTTSKRSRSPSASVANAKRWNGLPPRWLPTTSSARATTPEPPARAPAGAPSQHPRCRIDGPALAGPFAFWRAKSPARQPGRSIAALRAPAYARCMNAAELALVTVPIPGDEEIPGYMRALEAAAAYLPAEQMRLLRRAWAVGAAAHAGQVRKSGEPYITHPVAVAGVLAEQKVDLETLVAAILHDTIEDTPLTRAALASEFGESVAELVEGVTKLDKLHFASRREADAESFRKMMLAMARDLRVILIKLADRLHNMRTLDAMSPDSRRRIARETLEIYAPIAQRLGMNRFKAELQDLGFRALHPFRHAAIAKRIASQPVIRREAMATIEAQLAQRLAQEGLKHSLVSRVKSPWSIYNKMRQENKSLEQVLDVFGFRIVVSTVGQCYQALGAVHSVYKPLDGRFRDFIAIPKANGYQSLHTVLFGPYGAPVEVQIRTEDMDLV